MQGSYIGRSGFKEVLVLRTPLRGFRGSRP